MTDRYRGRAAFAGEPPASHSSSSSLLLPPFPVRVVWRDLTGESIRDMVRNFPGVRLADDAEVVVTSPGALGLDGPPSFRSWPPSTRRGWFSSPAA